MRVLKIIVMMILPFIGKTVAAQNLSNRGKEFWVGYGHHQFMEPGTSGGPQNGQEMVLYFSAESQPAHVTVTIRGTSYREDYDIPANTVIQSKLIPKGIPSSLLDARLYTSPIGYGGTGSEGIFSN